MAGVVRPPGAGGGQRAAAGAGGAPQGPVCLVSNATTRLERDLDALGLRAELDVVINSSRGGRARPAHLRGRWTRWGCPRAAFFVDDNPGLVDAARALGLSAHHFTGTAALAGALQEAGLLPAAEDIVRRGISPS